MPDEVKKSEMAYALGVWHEVYINRFDHPSQWLVDNNKKILDATLALIERSDDATGVIEATGPDCIVLGEGNIIVATGSPRDCPIDDELILARAKKPMPIGDSAGLKGRSTEDIDPIIRVQFKKPESVQVVMDALQKILRNLEPDHQDAPPEGEELDTDVGSLQKKNELLCQTIEHMNRTRPTVTREQIWDMVGDLTDYNEGEQFWMETVRYLSDKFTDAGVEVKDE